MNIKIKTAIIILITFIIGAVAGAMIDRAYIEYKMKKALSMRAPWGFADHFERVIEPTDKQREAVRKILFKYGEKFFEIAEKIRKESLPLQRAMEKELDAILTLEQKERLEKRMPRFGPRGFPDRFRPGFPGPFRDKPPIPPGMQPPPDKDDQNPPPKDYNSPPANQDPGTF